MSQPMQPVVRVHHYRVCLDADGKKILASMRQVREQELEILPYGGMTEVVLLEPDTEEVLAEGTAYCNDRDNYSKRMGRQIALGRALLDPDEKHRRLAHRQSNPLGGGVA